MAITSIDQLKLWFAKGLKPTALQFAAWMDSYWHKSDVVDCATGDEYGLRISTGYQKKIESEFSIQYWQVMAPPEPIGNDVMYNPTTKTMIVWVSVGTPFWLEITIADNFVYQFEGKSYLWNGEDMVLISSSINGQDGITPTIGVNGNWFIGTTDTGVRAQGTNGDPGTSVPVNLSIFKSGANGILPATSYSWISNLIVSQVVLQDGATDISVTINGTTYNKTTLIGVHLDSGVKMTGLDIILSAGQNSGSVIIIF